MTEPRETARDLELVLDGTYHWRIRNSAIGGALSSSHAVIRGGDCVLIDPVPLEREALAQLPLATAIVVTATCHQRAAWRYRRELAAQVWLPEGARPADEEPDHLYGDGDELPGGLRAVHTPGPEQAHYCLLDPTRGVLFCSDLVGNDESDELELIPAEYQDDPAASVRSIERLLELSWDVLCLDHGTPVLDGKVALRRALDRAPTHV